MKITIIPILKDNYSFLLECDDGTTAIIDPGDVDPFIDALEERGRTLDYILNTHHHWDHTDGNIALKARYGCKIAGPIYEREHIPGIDITLEEGTPFILGGEKLIILHTPGHTAGHISIYAPDSNALFTADTLFSMGCGRLFEGDAHDLWRSFEKYRPLPDETLVYCAHEYTIANAKFCLSVDPDNAALQQRHAEVKELRRKKHPTIPTTLGLEKQTNSFLRARSPEDLKRIRDLKDKA